MTQTQPERPAPVGVPWAPPPGVHWAGAQPPAGMPPVGWTGYGPPAPTRHSGMRWGWIVLGVVAAIVAVAIIGTVAQKTAKMTINGSVTVYGNSSLMTPGAGCQNLSLTGKPVSIYGSDGDLVGTSSLTGSGTAVNEWNTYSSGYADACRFSFTLTNVSAADDYYTVTLGSDRSSGVGFSREQLQSSGAQITYGHS